MNVPVTNAANFYHQCLQNFVAADEDGSGSLCSSELATVVREAYKHCGTSRSQKKLKYQQLTAPAADGVVFRLDVQQAMIAYDVDCSGSLEFLEYFEMILWSPKFQKLRVPRTIKLQTSSVAFSAQKAATERSITLRSEDQKQSAHELGAFGLRLMFRRMLSPATDAAVQCWQYSTRAKLTETEAAQAKAKAKNTEVAAEEGAPTKAATPKRTKKKTKFKGGVTHTMAPLDDDGDGKVNEAVSSTATAQLAEMVWGMCWEWRLAAAVSHWHMQQLLDAKLAIYVPHAAPQAEAEAAPQAGTEAAPQAGTEAAPQAGTEAAPQATLSASGSLPASGLLSASGSQRSLRRARNRALMRAAFGEWRRFTWRSLQYRVALCTVRWKSKMTSERETCHQTEGGRKLKTAALRVGGSQQEELASELLAEANRQLSEPEGTLAEKEAAVASSHEHNAELDRTVAELQLSAEQAKHHTAGLEAEIVALKECASGDAPLAAEAQGRVVELEGRVGALEGALKGAQKRAAAAVLEHANRLAASEGELAEAYRQLSELEGTLAERTKLRATAEVHQVSTEDTRQDDLFSSSSWGHQTDSSQASITAPVTLDEHRCSDTIRTIEQRLEELESFIRSSAVQQMEMDTFVTSMQIGLRGLQSCINEVKEDASTAPVANGNSDAEVSEMESELAAAQASAEAAAQTHADGLAALTGELAEAYRQLILLEGTLAEKEAAACTLDDRVSEVESELVAAQASAEAASREHAGVLAALAGELEQAKSQQKSIVSELEGTLAEKEAAVASSHEHNAELDRTVAELQSSAEEAKHHTAGLEAEIVALDTLAAEAQGRVVELEGRVGSVEGELAAAQASTEAAVREHVDGLAALTGELEEAYRQLSELEGTLAEKEAVACTLDDRVSEVEGELAAMQASAQAAVREHAGVLAALAGELEEAYKQLSELEGTLAEKEGVACTLDDRVSEVESELAAVQASAEAAVQGLLQWRLQSPHSPLSSQSAGGYLTVNQLVEPRALQSPVEERPCYSPHMAAHTQQHPSAAVIQAHEHLAPKEAHLLIDATCNLQQQLIQHQRALASKENELHDAQERVQIWEDLVPHLTSQLDLGVTPEKPRGGDSDGGRGSREGGSENRGKSTGVTPEKSSASSGKGIDKASAAGATFDLMDVNNDGVIDRAEWMAAYGAAALTRELYKAPPNTHFSASAPPNSHRAQLQQQMHRSHSVADEPQEFASNIIKREAFLARFQGRGGAGLAAAQRHAAHSLDLAHSRHGSSEDQFAASFDALELVRRSRINCRETYSRMME